MSLKEQCGNMLNSQQEVLALEQRLCLPLVYFKVGTGEDGIAKYYVTANSYLGSLSINTRNIRKLHHIFLVLDNSVINFLIYLPARQQIIVLSKVWNYCFVELSSVGFLRVQPTCCFPMTSPVASSLYY